MQCYFSCLKVSLKTLSPAAGRAMVCVIMQTPA